MVDTSSGGQGGVAGSWPVRGRVSGAEQLLGAAARVARRVEVGDAVLGADGLHARHRAPALRVARHLANGSGRLESRDPADQSEHLNVVGPGLRHLAVHLRGGAADLGILIPK